VRKPGGDGKVPAFSAQEFFMSAADGKSDAKDIPKAEAAPAVAAKPAPPPRRSKAAVAAAV
jgi:hypothetical protein